MNPQFKHDLLYDTQQDMIAELGKEEFLRQLNGVMKEFHNIILEKLPHTNIILMAMALDAMSIRMVEKGLALAKAMEKSGENS